MHTHHDVATTEAPPRGAAERANPVLVEIVRGAMVESRHRGAYAIVDTAGGVLLGAGDVEAPVYPRSAVKPIQALAFLEAGAAAAYGLSDDEIALACGSHGGAPAHVETVRGWLVRIGCAPDDLECGAHAPYDATAAQALACAGTPPSALHNNCSGKHAGFLTLARHAGWATAGYIRLEHPVQQRVLGILEQMCGLDLARAPRGRDGCGIPVIGIPLGNLALAMARLADPSDQPDARQAAAARVRAAMTRRPYHVGGAGRFDTVVIEALGGKALVKGGAEGVHCAAVPGAGLGIALKIDDGAKRAAEVAMAGLLARLDVFSPAERQTIDRLVRQAMYNHAGDEVGEARPAPGSGLGAADGAHP